ncbi:MAG: glycosyltransferase family 39 protein [Zavarzinia sp.]|nr:glycosyltransferase family 39 protein [Zavarzinia sp.]
MNSAPPPPPAPFPHRSPEDAGAFRFVVALSLGLCLFRLAVLFIGVMPLYLDEAQYWFWGQDLAFGYFSKPPLIGWAIAATTAVCGDGAACVKASSPIAYGIAPIFAWLLARNLFGSRVGVIAAIGFATLPGVAFSGFIISTDPLLLMCWTGALWTFERALATRERRWWLGTGVFLGIGMLAKYAMVYFTLPALIVVALGTYGRGKRQWGGLALAGLVGLLVLSPNLIWNALSGFETFRHTAANASVGAHIGNVEGVIEFLGDQVAIIGPVLAVVLVAVLAWPRGVFRDPGIRLLAWFSLPILGLLVMQAFLSRAHGNWAAVAFPGLSILLFAALSRLGYRRLITATLALHCVLFLVMGVGLAVGKVPFVTLSTATDPFRWIRGWDRLAEAVDEMRLADSSRPRAVITTERGATAELIYHLRDSEALIRRWSRDEEAPDDHFAMVLDLEDAVGCDAVIVARGDSLPDELTARFSAVEGPVRVDMRPYPDRKGTYHLFVGRDFGRTGGTGNTCRSITRTGRRL